MEHSKGVPGFELFILLFFTIGSVFAVISYTIYRNSRNLIENGIETKGIVIDLHRLKPREYPLAPSIRFFTKEGTGRVFHSSEARNPPAYQVGEEVTLHYDPKDPDNVHLQGNYLLVYVFGGMGAVFWLFSIWSVGSAVKAVFQWLFD
ncbi:DUF3592 domain-containing protein [Dyadobacter sp. CY261]|uniref:DUF3592 domain-containing protein n=1 Tax=Dyadobacter sp. CY261 TaxID=2907203 RepID=UPI001F22936D|nr:DUF3592 domain-containing protein [Dyadobacter sp. CY261]MCF0070230.1 DUF3592 domain-containing protein [Dyadobacter sp. CY261]